MEPYEIMTGVGELYIAPVGTAFPAVSEAPGASWRHLGYTQEGVTVELSQEIKETEVDQETGPVKATRTKERLILKTKLAESTLENLADYLGNAVTDTPPGVGTIGTRALPLYRGAEVKLFAMLFRGSSAYGAFPAQYELPYGYIGGNTELNDAKEENRQITVEFCALIDPNASSSAERFGRLLMQDAAALP